MTTRASPAGTGTDGREVAVRRVRDPALAPSRAISFTFDGLAVPAQEGETVAAALAAANVVRFGTRGDGSPRGLWCGIGHCQECVVTVNGVSSLRACVTPVVEDAVVCSQSHAAPAPPRRSTPAPAVASETHRPQLLIVGAGPAGLAAARAAAQCGVQVMMLDERSSAGGQYFKQVAKSHRVVDPSRMDAQAAMGRVVIDEVEALGVRIHRDAMVWGAFGPQELRATISGAPHLFSPERLIVAGGAYERGVPVPGWTLPGYMATGAAQTLLRAYRVTPGRRVLVAGNGPLNLQLAAELVAAGVDVVAVVEASARPGLASIGDVLRAARTAPRLVLEGLGILSRLWHAGVPVIHGSAVVESHGDSRVEACTIARIDTDGRAIPGTTTRFEVDTICAGYGFRSSNEIARALGCRHDVRPADGRLVTRIDADGATSLSGVYAIGDGVTLIGAHAARSQGFIAGCAAAGSLGLKLPASVSDELRGARRSLARHRSFQQSLWRLFDAPPLGAQLASAATIVCRCESVSRAAIDAAIGQGAGTLGAVKRRTRAGMGRCQGRYCESTIAAVVPVAPAVPRDELFGFSPRAPIRPVRIGSIA